MRRLIQYCTLIFVILVPIVKLVAHEESACNDKASIKITYAECTDINGNTEVIGKSGKHDPLLVQDTDFGDNLVGILGMYDLRYLNECWRYLDIRTINLQSREDYISDRITFPYSGPVDDCSMQKVTLVH